MDSVAHLAMSFREDEQLSDPEIEQPADRFFITPRDADILKPYLEEFQSADTQARKKILGRVMGELYALRPSDSVFDKKDAMRVRDPISSRSESTDNICRRLGHGSTTTMPVHIAHSSNLSAGGLLAMSSIRRTRMRLAN